nr:MAG TPA: hypothetical protein [Crassvirales sp.]
MKEHRGNYRQSLIDVKDLNIRCICLITTML